MQQFSALVKGIVDHYHCILRKRIATSLTDQPKIIWNAENELQRESNRDCNDVTKAWTTSANTTSFPGSPSSSLERETLSRSLVHQVLSKAYLVEAQAAQAHCKERYAPFIFFIS